MANRLRGKSHLTKLPHTTRQHTMTTIRKKKYWNKLETANLYQAAKILGTHNWKAVAADDRFALSHFSPIDLEKRYQRITSESDPTDQSDRKAISRRERRGFSAREDELLLTGFAQHGPRWSKILRDNEDEFNQRRSTDLRDRFRNAFPDQYASAGFKSRSKKRSNSTGSDREMPEIEIEVPTQPTFVDVFPELTRFSSSSTYSFLDSVSPVFSTSPRSLLMDPISPVSSYSDTGLFVSGASLALTQSDTCVEHRHEDGIDDWLGNAIHVQDFRQGDFY